MNIIASNCVGAQLYKLKGIKFSNPFIWSSVLLRDYLLLLQRFGSIDFHDIEVAFEDSILGTTNVPKITIEKQINCYFTHHKQKGKDDIIANDKEYCGNDLYCKNILEYVQNRWNERIERMDEPPIFIYDDIHYYKNDDINKLFCLNSDTKLLICTEDKTLLNKSASNIRVMLKTPRMDSLKVAQEILNNKVIEDWL